MKNKSASLPPALLHIIRDKGTEYPFSGEYDTLNTPGTYLCRQCGLGLFTSETKFHSGCGWPSFDSEINGQVQRIPDRDGQRTEILCARCNAHLGHVFEGERLTPLNTRHCVNSLSLDFVPFENVQDTEEAIVAAGCFWGVEYYFKKTPGVLKVEVGYTGGHQVNPTYEDVCSGTSGHTEAVRVVYDPKIVSYKKIIKFFFEIHDFTQTNGQGPDIGEQYLSVIFHYDEEQKRICERIMQLLAQTGFDIATTLHPVSTFWIAENYHQDYYQKTHKQPYCHHYTKRFEDE